MWRRAWGCTVRCCCFRCHCVLIVRSPGADKVSSIMASIPAGFAPHVTSSPLDPTALLTSTSVAPAVSPWSSRTKHVICARFRARRTVPMDRTNTKGILPTSPPTGTWLILRLGDETSRRSVALRPRI